MYSYKIDKLIYKNGLEVNPGTLTVFVGPNNSGKSRLLKDILLLSTSNQNLTTILQEVEFVLPDSYEHFAEAYKINVVQQNGSFFLRTLDSSLTKGHSLNVGGINWHNDLKSWLLKERYENAEFIRMARGNFASYFGHFLVTLLLTEDRLKLTKESPSGQVKHEVNNLLQAFYKEGKDAEVRLREIVKSTFNIDVRLDYSSLTTLCIRVGQDLDKISRDPMESREEFEKLERLDEQGDGIKSFISTYLSILLGQKPVLLLDEPEAFLHPPQAFRLGELIAEQAINNKQIFIATHSVDLLRGILSRRQDITLLRLNRENNVSTYKFLNPEELKAISNDPLLGSSRILEGIFYKGVVVLEADSDATFYQRISRPFGNSDDIHYAHAHNKQTVTKVAEPYRSLGVRFCVIVDFDVFRERDEFKKILESLAFPHEEFEQLLQLRQILIEEIEASDPNEILLQMNQDLEMLLQENKTEGDAASKLLRARRQLKRIREERSSWHLYKQQGKFALSDVNQKTFDQIDQICVQRGLFIVPVGELESWLVDFSVSRTSNKSKWIVTALEQIPNLVADENSYPWSFMKRVHEYLNPTNHA